MVNYKYFDLFYKDNVDKQAKIEYSGGVMTNAELFQNSEELTESLCSEKELRFGSCEAGSLKFKVANIVKPMMGETVTFSIVVDHHENEPLLVGRYKVASDKETADRRYREVVAYDAMYDILNADMAAWYNALLPEGGGTVTLGQFRESFVRYFGLTEVLPRIGATPSGVPVYGLVNDTMEVGRTIRPEQISGRDIITAICEVNGCFGHIGRDGKFHYIYLPQAIEGLYPANDLYPDHAPEWMAQAKTGHLYPQGPKSTLIGKGSYIPPCNYEGFRTKPITKIQIRQEENDIGKIWPETPPDDKDNCYIIQDNFLVYGKTSDELAVIAQNILGKVTDIVYRPFGCTAVGNPCLEVGDPVRLHTKYELVESYILTRTMKGIQAIRDTYQSDGVPKYTEQVNGVHRSIVQLKGKANILTRTIEETKLEMYDIAEGLSNTVTATAKEIRAELKDTADGLNNTVTATAKEIRAELKDTADGLNNTVTVTAKEIRAELKDTSDGLNNTITVTAGQIRTEVADADRNLQTQITQNAGDIALRVTKDGVVAAINLSPEAVTIKAGKIDLQGLVEAQELTAKFATISTLNATTAELNGLIAQRATIGQLDASNARISSLEVDHVSVGEFNAATASLESLIAGKIDASTVKADYMEVANWTSAGKIKADRIDADMIVAKIGSYEDRVTIHNILTTNIVVYSQLFVGDLKISTSATWRNITVGTRTYSVLCQN